MDKKFIPIKSLFLEKELIGEIEKSSSFMVFQEGEIVVKPDKYIKVVPIILSGTLRIIREDNKGNEVFLYYINEGKSCAVSLSTCLIQAQSQIKAVAETKVELIAIPATLVNNWYKIYPSWRNFVIQTLHDRMDELFKTVDTLAFSKLEDRLELWLVGKVRILNSGEISITHQEIAKELATTREVISRLLKHLENEGKLILSRNHIKINSLMYQKAQNST